jgi:hypothetical protein
LLEQLPLTDLGKNKMNNDILRAGPYAEASGEQYSFLNKPEIPASSILPVNCAMLNWANDPWQLAFIKTFTTDNPPYSDESIEYLNGPVVSERVTSTGTDPNGFNQCSINFLFKTQSVVPFQVKVIATGNSTEDNAGYSFSCTEGTDQDGSGVLFSGEQIVTIPPSVKPQLFQAIINVAASAALITAVLEIEPFYQST